MGFEEVKADIKMKQKYILEQIITNLVGKLIQMFSLYRSKLKLVIEHLERQEQ